MYEVKCDQKVEYGTIKSSIVRISQLYTKAFIGHDLKFFLSITGPLHIEDVADVIKVDYLWKVVQMKKRKIALIAQKSPKWT